ncbi:hypothetical protein HD554DRAFT_2051278 [Boletus coccyginus]|nr:hypothetical protein HD554DRAFT_2051278 [Boletus coccyginus]
MPPATTTTTMPPAKPRDPHSQKPQSNLVNTNGSQAERECPQPVARGAPLPTPVSGQLYAKKVPHRSSKPIINWLQRKLGGSARARRIPDGNSLNVAPKSATNTKNHLGATTAPASRPNGRSVSSPWPQVTTATSQRQGAYKRGVPSAMSQRRTISLNDVETEPNQSLHSDDDRVEASTYRSSLARDSMWSPVSALEADEDASLRPLPPSSPPSPSLSHSSSSYISHPRTFRSIAASTKPTTVLSIDLPLAGVAHIAQVPVTPISQISPRHAPHARTSSTGTNGGLVSSGASITFSALPPSPESVSHPPSSLTHTNPGLLGHNVHGLQAPLHTAHHPRNNPRPSSPPLDNASMLTLASSAYAIPGARMTIGSMGSATLSGLLGGGDSISHLGGSILGDPEGENTSQFLLVDDDRLDVDGERDVDASLRALRPRSSRRGSWDSEVSGWSAKVLGVGPGITVGNKNTWTSSSMKIGGPVSLEDRDDEKVDESMVEGGVGPESPSEAEGRGVSLASEVSRDDGGNEPESKHAGTRELYEDVPSTLGRSTGPVALKAPFVGEDK